MRGGRSSAIVQFLQLLLAGVASEAAARIRTLWVLKMLSTASGIAVFFYAYFWAMRHPLGAVTVMPVTWIDELIGFQPLSFPLYVFLWVYISLGTALAKDLRELATFGAASLAFCMFTAVVLHAQLTTLGAGRWLRAANALLGVGILYSTLATRQHVALDAFAGVVLGGAASIAYLVALRRRRGGRGD